MSAFDENNDGRMDMQERKDKMEFNYGDKDDDGAMNRQEFGRVEGELIEMKEKNSILLIHLISRCKSI